MWLLILISLLLAGCKEQKVKDSTLIQALELDFEFIIKMEGSKGWKDLQFFNLNNEIIIDKNWDNFKNEKKLYFYFENIHCSSCVENEIRLLKTFFDANQVIILTKNQNARELQVFKKVHQFDFDMYYWNSRIDNEVSFPPENWLRPFYFILNEDGKMTNLYSPKFSYLELSHSYLDKIKRFYFTLPPESI